MRVLRVLIIFLWATFSCSFPQTKDIPKNLAIKELHFRTTNKTENFNLKIINGHESIPHSHPSLAYLTFTGFFQSWLCGGSLISPNYVLTAGHCTKGAHSAIVLLGAHNTTAKEQSQKSVRSQLVLTHPKYNEDGIQNDIGLIKLEDPVELNDDIQILNLPTAETKKLSNEYEGDIATVAGWGYTQGSGHVSDVVREISVQILGDDECLRYFSIYQNYELCTSGEDGKSACSGDSGSPLIVNNEQIGIVSYGASSCPTGYPTVYTKIVSFLEWILDNSDAQATLTT